MPRYIGYLEDRGLPAAELARVRVPAGLDLGSTTHPEIAVAILAELVQLRAAGALTPGEPVPARKNPGQRPGEHDGQPASPAPQATDPVCGMTVAASPDGLPAEYEGTTLLLLQRRLPPGVPVRPCRLREERDPMLIKSDFEVAEPVEKVWQFFENIPQVATCLPGAELTEDLGGEKYKGKVAIRMGPVRLQFAGTADITERDEAARRVVVTAAGADERGRGQASMVVTATLARAGRGTRVDVTQDLQLSGAAAQYGRGMITDVSSVLMADFSKNMQDRIARIERGESAEQIAASSATPAGGFALGLRAARMALSRVFRRFFLPYQPASY